MNFDSVKFKIVIITILCLAVGSIAIINLLGVTHNNNKKLAAQEAVRMSKEIFYNIEMNNTKILSSEVQFLSKNSRFKKAFVNNNREALYEILLPLFNRFKDRYGINYCSFIIPGEEGEYLLRVHEPEKFGDTVRRATYAKTVQTNELSYGKELEDNSFALSVVYPYYDGEELVGYIELGEETGDFLEMMKKQTGDEYWLLIDKSYMDEKKWASMRTSRGLENNWKEFEVAVPVSATADNAKTVQFDGTISDIPNEGAVFDDLIEDGRVFVRGAFPVYDVNSRKVGVVYVSHEVTKMYDEFKSLQSKVIIYMTVVAVILCSLIIIIFNYDDKIKSV